MKFKLQKFKTPLTVSRIANIHYFEFTSQYHTFDDFHDFCELLYVDNGVINVKSENYSGELSDNQLIIHSPNEKHSLKCAENLSPNVIIIGFECNAPEIGLFSHSPITLQANHKKILSEIMKEGMNTFAPPYDIPNTLEMKKREDYPFASEQMLKINLELLLITLIRDNFAPNSSSSNSASSSGKLSDICKYIDEHYTESFNLDNLCLLFGTNKTSLCHNFKNEYGITVFDYIAKLKIKAAKRLLREQKLSVTEISYNLGFSSVHYFCRHFKKHTELSTTEYKKTIKSRLDL